jgi:hypothetical protein
LFSFRAFDLKPAADNGGFFLVGFLDRHGAGARMRPLIADLRAIERNLHADAIVMNCK